MTEKKRYNQLEPASFSAGQSGGDQGLPRDATADSESVEELLEEGNFVRGRRCLRCGELQRS